MIQNWNDKRVTVMGLGRFGGGVGVTRWLVAAGAKVLVTDQAAPDRLRASLDEIADLDVALRLGGHEERDFRETDLVVVNPAVPDASPLLQAARVARVPITTEINLFVERCPAGCIGVTGTVGKSTVSAMIGHVLQEATKRPFDLAQGRLRDEATKRPFYTAQGWLRDEGTEGAAEATRAEPTPSVSSPRSHVPTFPRSHVARRVWVGGNIGRSLLDALGQIAADDIVVLELSSFQLQRTPDVHWSPHIAVITSITPNHLDWHGSFAAYLAAKLNVVRYQDPRRDIIVMQDTAELGRTFDQLPGERSAIWRYGLDGDTPVAVLQPTWPGNGRHGDRPLPFRAVGRDERCLRWDGLSMGVPGRHNRENAAAALTVAHCLGVPSDAASAALASFAALPHRLQQVAVRDGVKYFDDSKSTTPEAALTALGAIEAPLLVILGGYDKGSDLRPVAAEAARRARFAACIGTTGPGLAEAIRAAGGQAAVCDDLSAAVTACRQRARPGDAVLLSPACASWDQFADYRARGELFARLARG